MTEQHTATTSTSTSTAALATIKRTHTESETEDAQQQENSNPIIYFFVNILKLLPLPKNQPKVKVNESITTVIKENVEEKKPSFVTFPKHEHEFPSLKFEAEHADTNSFLLWPVYAIGSVFVLRWAWCRWNERKRKQLPSNEEHPTEDPPNEDPPKPPCRPRYA